MNTRTIINSVKHIFIKNITTAPIYSQSLQSAMFTINKTFVVGLISSLITAVIGYAIRLLVFKYFDYDFFTNLDNWKVSLPYFCSLGAFRFAINECLKNTFLMSPAISGPEGHMPFSSSSTAGNTFSMANPRGVEGSVSRANASDIETIAAKPRAAKPRAVEGSVSRANASEIETTADKPRAAKPSSSRIRKLIPIDNPSRELVKELSELKKDSDVFHNIESNNFAKMLLPFSDFIKLYDPHLSKQDSEMLIKILLTKVDTSAEVPDIHEYWKAKRRVNNDYYKKSNEMIQVFETNSKAIQEKLGGKKDIRSEYFRKDLQTVKKIYSDIHKQKEAIIKKQLGKSYNTDKLLKQNGISIDSIVNKIIK